MDDLGAKLDRLYHGHDQGAVRFQYGLLGFDILTVLFFVASSMLEDRPSFILVADYVLGALLAADYCIRLAIAKNRLRYALQLVSIADLVVIVTLLGAAMIENFAFLRVVRALRLLRSYRVVRDLRRRYAFFARNEELINSVVNLVVFIFVITALVYVLQVRENPQIKTYIDALYFTITTLTTTGFGDITLTGTTGRALSIVVMVLGVALFLRLVQTIFQPAKVRYKCPDCGLNRHDPDAVHCKHCGRMLNIETEGR